MSHLLWLYLLWLYLLWLYLLWLCLPWLYSLRRYASSVLKTFATSVALVFVCFVSWLHFEARLAPLFLLGVRLVLALTLTPTLTPILSLTLTLAPTLTR